MEIAGGTSVGRVRKNNEDTFAFSTEIGLALVADGMGGAACGEVASAMTVDEIVTYLKKNEDPGREAELLEAAIAAANSRVWTQAHSGADCGGMGSTVVLALWRDERMWIANVGDSRAYLFRDGRLEQLSYDQNFANELRATLGLNDHQISQYPQRNALTMAIGTKQNVRGRFRQIELQAGDRILLCSDGLSGPLKDMILARILGSEPALQGAVDKLIDLANQAGGPDNITAVLLAYS
jgi:protein phosphatase